MKLPKSELTFLGALASLVVTACSGDGSKPGGATANPAADGAGSEGISSSSGGTGAERGLGSGGVTGTGDTVGVGGASVTGGTVNTGGSVSSGGVPSTGGTVNTGGSVSSGGVPSTGGTVNTGGSVSSGGVPSTGGTVNTGGSVSSGGASVTGGTVNTGGSVSSGGAPSTGGTVGSGGTSGVGGSESAGGTSDTGGTEDTGGATGATPFKGIAYNGICNDLDAVGATWFYSWSTSSNCRPANGAEYVPMFWGSVGNPSPQALYDQGYRTVLTFNEPERSDQASLTVSDALALWPELEATGLRLGSPATASSGEGEAWLADFMEQAEAGGHRVDFIALHWYGWGVGGCANINAHFTGFIERAAGYGRPIWIMEWGCYGDDAATVKAFYETAVAWLLEREDIERYAWFLTRGQEGDAAWDGQKLIDSSADLTPLGDSYVASPAMR